MLLIFIIRMNFNIQKYYSIMEFANYMPNDIVPFCREIMSRCLWGWFSDAQLCQSVLEADII